MSRSRKAESGYSDCPTTLTVEMEVIVQKAIAAAVSVLRDELTKMFDGVNQRLAQMELQIANLEKSMQDVPASVQRVESVEHILESVEQRILCLEKKPTADYQPIDLISQLEEVKRESRDCLILANNNEQYSRRNNLRIRGLTLRPQDDVRQVVADFCRNKLNMVDFETDCIDMAHVIPVRQSSTAASTSTAGSRVTTEPSVLVRFRQHGTRDNVLRKRKALKGSHFSVVEDLTNLNVQTLNRVKNTSEVQTCWSWNGRIYALLKSNVKIMVNPFQPLASCQVIS